MEVGERVGPGILERRGNRPVRASVYKGGRPLLGLNYDSRDQAENTPSRKTIRIQDIGIKLYNLSRVGFFVNPWIATR